MDRQIVIQLAGQSGFGANQRNTLLTKLTLFASKLENMLMNKGIVVTEKQIVEAMNDMCVESLPPELFSAWEDVKLCLEKTRKELVEGAS